MYRRGELPGGTIRRSLPASRKSEKSQVSLPADFLPVQSKNAKSPGCRKVAGGEPKPRRSAFRQNGDSAGSLRCSKAYSDSFSTGARMSRFRV